MKLQFCDSHGRKRESNHNSMNSLLDEAFYQYKKRLPMMKRICLETDDALDELIDGITNDIKQIIK